MKSKSSISLSYGRGYAELSMSEGLHLLTVVSLPVQVFARLISGLRGQKCFALTVVDA